MWSLILAILSYVCLPFILAVVAIILGFMGRKRAKEQGAGTGMATAGIVLGFLNIIVYAIVFVILLASGAWIFGQVSSQLDVAPEVQSASVAAERYGFQNDTYEGLSTDNLTTYGYVPSNTVTVKAVSLAGGAGYCVEGYKNSEPDNVIHMPVLGSDATVSITAGGSSYTYALGSCPRS